ncbi:hypothetical protein HETIRDRAFT_324013 [Heterobasidion irregulare TC 32-1]|uniref:Uncharacterized protein n=1 Tax=Heterobasidion irregulare (strain TC 32-1) TaxID=747525 RepID=W4K0S3_HETIT|nr:uncharacterized protein HETIRDRAFT_324013 [Heterobasidion irregulare TC 32-1]ETW78726.1 hypothetical protein HETIRDRAFT_324013 [Heterobasidion irregulare TC 32-1]
MPPALPRPLSVHAFLSEYARLWQLADNTQDAREKLSIQMKANKYMLTGIHVDENYQASIEPLRNAVTVDEQFTITRDYDSLIGFADDIPLRNGSLLVFTVLSKDLTLQENIHIHVWFLVGPAVASVPPTASFLCMPPLPLNWRQWQSKQPHTVPNIGFAKFGEQHSICIFFPVLCDDAHTEADIYLTVEERQELYNDVVYPAARLPIPHSSADWPAGFAAETFRVTKAGGNFMQLTKLVGQYDIHPFVAALKARMDQKAWMRGARFMVQKRGTKLATYHPQHGIAARTKLTEYLTDLDTSVGSWWADVGLEVSYQNRAYHWQTDMHSAIL